MTAAVQPQAESAAVNGLAADLQRLIELAETRGGRIVGVGDRNFLTIISQSLELSTERAYDTYQAGIKDRLFRRVRDDHSNTIGIELESVPAREAKQLRVVPAVVEQPVDNTPYQRLRDLLLAEGSIVEGPDVPDIYLALGQRLRLSRRDVRSLVMSCRDRFELVTDIDDRLRLSYVGPEPQPKPVQVDDEAPESNAGDRATELTAAGPDPAGDTASTQQSKAVTPAKPPQQIILEFLKRHRGLFRVPPGQIAVVALAKRLELDTALVELALRALYCQHFIAYHKVNKRIAAIVLLPGHD